MNAPATLAVPTDAEAFPAVEVFRFDDSTALVTRDARGRIVAWLRERERRLFVAAYRHALDARVLGRMSSTIELSDLGPDLPVRWAAAVQLAADARGVWLDWIDCRGLALARTPFDDDAYARLTAEGGG